MREIKVDTGVECLAFSPDGKILAAGCFDHAIRLVDAASGELIRKLVGHKGFPIQLAFSPDGKVLASASEGQEIARFWDVASAKEISKIEDRESRHRGISTVAFSPDGKLIATAGGEGYLFLWDAATGKNIRELPTGYWVRSMVFAPDSHTIAIGQGPYQGRHRPGRGGGEETHSIPDPR